MQMHQDYLIFIKKYLMVKDCFVVEINISFNLQWMIKKWKVHDEMRWRKVKTCCWKVIRSFHITYVDCRSYHENYHVRTLKRKTTPDFLGSFVGASFSLVSVILIHYSSFLVPFYQIWFKCLSCATIIFIRSLVLVSFSSWITFNRYLLDGHLSHSVWA